MKKTVLIVNNNLNQAEELKKLVLEVNETLEVYVADKVASAYEILMNMTVDAFIVDAVMDLERPGDTSGIRLVARIREINKYILTPVIFVTTEKDPEMYAYTELNCLGYLKKPYKPEQFKVVFEKALHYRTERNENRALFFRRGGVIFPIKVKDIVYIESISHVMYVHLSDGTVVNTLYKTCSNVLSEADSENLFQCSRSVVINRNFVLGVDMPNRYIVLKGDRGKVDIGVTYRKRVLEEFGNLKISINAEG